MRPIMPSICLVMGRVLTGSAQPLQIDATSAWVRRLVVKCGLFYCLVKRYNLKILFDIVEE
jgi:hypothetical protein